MATISKTQRILQYIQNGWTITNFSAFKLFKLTRLGSVIHELRKKYVIETETKTDSDGNQYAEYRYVREKSELPKTE